MQAGLDAEWPYVEELFDPSYVDPALVASGVAVDPRTLRDPWNGRIDGVLAEATLTRPEVPPARGGGRRGDPHRADGLPARRDAAPGPVAPGGDMVMV